MASKALSSLAPGHLNDCLLWFSCCLASVTLVFLLVSIFNILRALIKKFLYSDHEIFLRELVSNAVDATQKLKTLSSVGEFKGELGDLTVQVKFDDKTITISDR